MARILQLFHMGGFFMWVVLALGVAGLAAGIVHLVLARGWSKVLGLILVVSPLAAGLIGTQLGMVQVNAALQGVAPEHMQALRAVGEQEAALNWKLGAVLSGIALLPLAGGEVRRRLRD